MKEITKMCDWREICLTYATRAAFGQVADLQLQWPANMIRLGSAAGYEALSATLLSAVVTRRQAGMAELADAADLKSADPKGLWGFESPSRHHLTYSCIVGYGHARLTRLG